MISTAISTEITGTVERVGSYGFVLIGREGWVSLSKFASPKPELPQIGEQVRVALDKAGYARAIDVVTPTVTYSGGFHVVKDALAPRSTEPAASASVDRDSRIMRQAVLNTAVAILSSGGQVAEIGDVISYAETLEAWVLR